MLVSAMLHAKGGSVGTITPDATVRDLCAQLAELRVGALVVSNDGSDIVGIVSERDVVRGLAARGDGVMEAAVTEIMTSEVLGCSREDKIDDLMRQMTENRVRHLPVVEDSKMIGLVSIGDVVKYRVDELEHEAQAMQEYIKTG